jgi:hypothetical protein
MFADVSAMQLLANMLRNQQGGPPGGRDAVLDLFRSIGIVRIVGDDEDDDDDERALVVRPHDSDDDEA